MLFQLAPEKSFAENVAHLTSNRLDRALEKLSGVIRDKLPAPRGSRRPPGLAKTIHGARKDLKHTRALLRLARYGMNPLAFKHENVCLRDAGRALSAARDAQVLVEVFDRLDLAAHTGEPAQGHLAPGTPARIRRQLTDQAGATTRADQLLPAVKQASGILEGVRTRLPSWGLEEGGWRSLAGGLKAVYRDGRGALATLADDAANLGGAGDAFAWHEWRKHVKHLGYHLRLLRPLWPRVIKEVAAEVDKLADLLGDDHDLTVLHDRFTGGVLQTEDPAELAVLGGLITTRRAALQRRAFEIGHRVYQEKPGRFVRRFAGYWKAWRQEHPGEVRTAAVKAED